MAIKERKKITSPVGIAPCNPLTQASINVAHSAESILDKSQVGHSCDYLWLTVAEGREVDVAHGVTVEGAKGRQIR